MSSCGVLQRNGKWYAVIYYKEKGVSKQKRIATPYIAKGNKKKALNYAQNELIKFQELENNNKIKTISAENRNLTFCDVIEQYIKAKSAKVEYSTTSGYLTYFKKIKAYFKKTLLKDVDGYMLDDFYNSLRKVGLKDISIKKYHEVIRPAMKLAKRRRLITDDPCEYIEPFKKSNFRPTIYNADELKVLFEKIAGTRYELPVKIAAFYGLRKSEVLGLKWDAIDFVNKSISIKHKVITIKKEIVRSDELKTEASYRTLPLIPYIEELLLKERKKQEENKKKFASVFKWENKDYIMIDEVGHLLRSDNLGTRFGQFLKKNNLKHIRFHDLRHSCASLLVANGIGIKQVQDWLGHSNFLTTANVYSHLDYSSKLESAEKISALLDNNSPQKQQVDYDEYQEFLQWKKSKSDMEM